MMENKMTTEQFLADLVANTVKLNKARLDYAQKLSELRDNYDEELDSIQARERQALDELHDAREEFESSEEKYKIDCQGLRRERNMVGREYNKEKAKAKNDWATKNQDIQNERHRIFEKYRDSGGILSGIEEGLLHPGWMNDKKGGLSDEFRELALNENVPTNLIEDFSSKLKALAAKAEKLNSAMREALPFSVKLSYAEQMRQILVDRAKAAEDFKNKAQKYVKIGGAGDEKE